MPVLNGTHGAKRMRVGAGAILGVGDSLGKRCAMINRAEHQAGGQPAQVEFIRSMRGLVEIVDIGGKPVVDCAEDSEVLRMQVSDDRTRRTRHRNRSKLFQLKVARE